jgi:hypothetical protein
MRNIGCVCQFIEPKRHIFAYRTKCRGDNEKQKNNGANASVGLGRDRALILQGCIEITWGRHRASLHWHPLNKSYAIAAARGEPG